MLTLALQALTLLAAGGLLDYKLLAVLHPVLWVGAVDMHHTPVRIHSGGCTIPPVLPRPGAALDRSSHAAFETGHCRGCEQAPGRTEAGWSGQLDARSVAMHECMLG